MENAPERRIEKASFVNPSNRGADDVPALLRRVADSLDRLGAIEVADLVLHQDVREGEFVASISVYFRTARRPADLPSYAASMDIPIRDEEGRVVGHRSRGTGEIGATESDTDSR